MSSPSNLSLPSSNLPSAALALALALALPSASRAQSAPPSAERVQWLSAPPCAEDFAAPMPGQPTLGLALYRYACPGSPPKLVSGRREALAVISTHAQLLARGESPRADLIRPGAPQWIASAQQSPLDPAQAERSQARRPLRAGEPLLARDFEPRRLWIGGERVALALRQGAVTTTVQATALGVGRWGERASVKTDHAKVFVGIAGMCSAGPCLDVAP